MQDQLEQELRRLIIRFAAEVKFVVIRNLQSAIARASDSGADSLVHATQDLARPAVDLPAHRAPARRTLTPDQLAAVRAQLTTLIRQQSGRSTAELARILGIPSAKLRRQLRQLIDERVIEVDENGRTGFRRYRYRAAEPNVEHGAEPLVLVAGASA